MNTDYKKLSEQLKAIAHPVRLRMVEGLLHNECSVGKIVSELKLPQSTVSQHLSVLRTRDIIRPRREGTKTCYSVCDEKISDIIRLLTKPKEEK